MKSDASRLDSGSLESRKSEVWIRLICGLVSDYFHSTWANLWWSINEAGIKGVEKKKDVFLLAKDGNVNRGRGSRYELFPVSHERVSYPANFWFRAIAKKKRTGGKWFKGEATTGDRGMKRLKRVLEIRVNRGHETLPFLWILLPMPSFLYQIKPNGTCATQSRKVRPFLSPRVPKIRYVCPKLFSVLRYFLQVSSISRSNALFPPLFEFLKCSRGILRRADRNDKVPRGGRDKETGKEKG